MVTRRKPRKFQTGEEKRKRREEIAAERGPTVTRITETSTIGKLGTPQGRSIDPTQSSEQEVEAFRKGITQREEQRQIVTRERETAAARQEIEAPLQEERREAVREELGTAELTERLTTGIAEPLELQPPPLLLSAREEAPESIFLPSSAEGRKRRLEFFGTESKTPAVLAAIGAGVGVGLLGAAGAAGFAVTTAARTVVTKSVLGTGGSVLSLRNAVKLSGGLLGAKIAFDFRGGEINNIRIQLQKVVEDGERIEATGRLGLPPEDTIPLLRTMVEEVEGSESRLKELAAFNVQYRLSKEFVTDIARVRSAREALLRRVLALENVAAAGTAQLQPAELMLSLEQFD